MSDYVLARIKCVGRPQGLPTQQWITGPGAKCVFDQPLGSASCPGSGAEILKLCLEVTLKKPENSAVALEPRPERNERERKPQPDAEALKEREKFAKALTKSLFGRHYWDERSGEELRRAMTQRRSAAKK